MTDLTPESRTAGLSSKRREQAGAIAAAALLLPGLTPKVALAENAPEQGVVSVKYLYYQDKQPGLDRIQVQAPSFYALVPFAGEWSFEASVVRDNVSGATPRYYSSISGATKYDIKKASGGIKDTRVGGDAKLAYFMPRGSVFVGAAVSAEDDYTGSSVSAGGSFSLPGNNTTFNLGVSASSDKMSSAATVSAFGNADGVKPQDKSRTVNEVLVGVTQVMSKRDILQANLTVSQGTGYYNDPYKLFDSRPDKRDIVIGLVRWNHHFDRMDATLRTSLRLYGDSFGVMSQTLGADWVQSAGSGWTLTPGVRYYSQSAADFYKDPRAVLINSQVEFVAPQGMTSTKYYSADQRLSAFGAFTASLKISKEIAKIWAIDGKAEVYQQRGEWRALGKGSPGIDQFDAAFFQVGVSAKF